MSKTNIITIHAVKGGVCKTSNTLSIGTILADQGFKVLLCDTDPQASLTHHLIQDVDESRTIRQVLLGEERMEDCIIQSDPDYPLFVCPSQLKLMAIEQELSGENNPGYFLYEALESVQDDFDYIVIDTQPNLNLMTRSALIASDTVVIPQALEKFAAECLSLSYDCIEGVRKAQRYIDADIKTIKILPVMFERNRILGDAYLKAIREGYREDVSEHYISRAAAVAQVYSTPGAKLSEGMKAYGEYASFVDQLIEEVE
jgi:chromosome partitioning protein